MNLEIIWKPEGLIFIINAAAIVIVSIMTLAGFLGRLSWQLDLFSHFRVQYFFLLIGFTGVSLFFNNKIIAILGLGFIGLNLLSIIPIYKSRRGKNLDHESFRILLSNLLKSNMEYHKLRKVIQDVNPDILFLIEISDSWLRELASVIDKFPYRYITSRSDNYGLAIFSCFAFKDVQTKYFSDAKVPSLVVDIDFGNHLLTIIGTHPPPPKSREETIFRNQQLRNIAFHIAQLEKPTILIGDLNITSWSPYFREFMEVSKLQDSRQGFGIQPTWPSDKPVFMVPIDHVLVSEGIHVKNRFTGPNIGSDHRPVIVDLSLRDNSDKIDFFG